MNEIVKYRNEFNTVEMRKWSSNEMDLLHAIITKLKNKGTEKLQFDKKDLCTLANITDEHDSVYISTMAKLTKHVSQLQYIEDNSKTFMIMNLFQTFKFDKADGSLVVRLNSDFEYILNKWDDFNFTSYQLGEFVQLKSTYSKQLYRQMKQWKTLGVHEFSMEDFRRLLSVPKSYNTGAIQRRILEPAQKELSNYFIGLRITPIKKKTKGNPIIAYRFTWRPETTNDWVAGQIQTRHDQPKGTKKRKGTVKLGMPEYYNKPVEEVTEPASQESLDKVKEMLDRMNNTPADGQTTIEDFIEEEKK